MDQQIEAATQKKKDATRMRQQTLRTLKSGNCSEREYEMLLTTLELCHELLKTANHQLDLLDLRK